MTYFSKYGSWKHEVIRNGWQINLTSKLDGFYFDVKKDLNAWNKRGHSSPLSPPLFLASQVTFIFSFNSLGWLSSRCSFVLHRSSEHLLEPTIWLPRVHNRRCSDVHPGNGPILLLYQPLLFVLDARSYLGPGPVAVLFPYVYRHITALQNAAVSSHWYHHMWWLCWDLGVKSWYTMAVQQIWTFVVAQDSWRSSCGPFCMRGDFWALKRRGCSFTGN